MRTTIVAIAAVLAALVVGGAAIAGQGGLDLASDDSDEVTEAATEETTEDGDLEEATEDTESEDAKDKADDAKPESDDAEVTDTETPFGEIRSAEVHAAIEAGEQPEPAWKNPAHPTGGPEREQA